ncbi:GGDEF domain-containing protein [Anaeromyxobacter terrae]|uniref:GGDEF domain-containing protein n=1 Tax=Anaeromyxobacter terrae TaxID=2925406 RepID=UPI001F59581F|nr:GGDEF domain-containing protein [Anaeromyxobacter sp. SG22]
MPLRSRERPAEGPALTPPPGRVHGPSRMGLGAEAPSGLARAAWLGAAFGMTVCVGFADYLTGTDVSLILLYLAPIGFSTWFVTLRGGIALSIGGAIVATAADTLYRLESGGRALPVAVLGWNGVIQLGTSLALVLVLNALRVRLEAEELLARTDTLTHIPNRRAFIEAATLELERARRHRRPLTFAYVDCDDFKDVNDRLGHAEGDALLAVVGRTLRSATRAIDTVARLGGDEFGLLLPETDEPMAEALLARLQATLRETMERHGWAVRFSVGAAVFRKPAVSVDEMMARADELMYAAKRTAKGSVRLGVFDGGARASAARPR